MSDQTNSDETKPKMSEAGAKKTAGAAAAASPTKRLKAKVQTAEKAAAETAASLRHEAEEVGSDLAGKAMKTASDTAARLRSAVEEQKVSGAERARGIAGAINRAADELEDEVPLVANYVRRAADELEHLSNEVRNRDAGELLTIVEDFARRKPAMVLGATALVGFAAVRFLMTSARSTRVSAASSDIGPDQTRRDSAALQARPAPSGSGASEVQNAHATRTASQKSASSAPSSSGDPGGVSPRAPGFEPAEPESSAKGT